MLDGLTPREGETRAPPYHKVYSEAEARRYAESKEWVSSSHRGELKLVRRAFARIPRGESVLDLPCGAGRLTVPLVRWGYVVTAADVSPAMLELAAERFRREGIDVPLSRADLEQRTGFSDRQFDNVFCFRVLHHLPTGALRLRVVTELCRLARRRVLLSYLDSRSYTAWRRRLQDLVTGRSSGRHASRAAELAALFEAQGFRVRCDLARWPVLHSLRIAIAERAPEAKQPANGSSVRGPMPRR